MEFSLGEVLSRPIVRAVLAALYPAAVRAGMVRAHGRTPCDDLVEGQLLRDRDSRASRIPMSVRCLHRKAWHPRRRPRMRFRLEHGRGDVGAGFAGIAIHETPAL